MAATQDARGNLHDVTDGRFAEKTRASAAGDLDGATDEVDELLRQRALAAAAGVDYLPPTALPSRTDPRFAAGIERWWDTATAAAEYDAGGASGVPLMPNDFGSETEGRGHSGLRRIPRMRYSSGDEGLELRMPSASRVRSYAATVGVGERFDLPVEIEVDGTRHIGHVRVRSLGNGLYDVHPMSFPQEVAGEAALSVSAVLESRRVGPALRHRHDVHERHAERRKAAVRDLYEDRPADGGVIMRPVKGSFITEAGYNRASGEAMVTIDNGRGPSTYVYRDVSQSDWDSFVSAESKGSAYNQVLKFTNDAEGNRVARNRRDAPRPAVIRCHRCRAVYAGSHRCDKATRRLLPNARGSILLALQDAGEAFLRTSIQR